MLKSIHDLCKVVITQGGGGGRGGNPDTSKREEGTKCHEHNRLPWLGKELILEKCKNV